MIYDTLKLCNQPSFEFKYKLSNTKTFFVQSLVINESGLIIDFFILYTNQEDYKSKSYYITTYFFNTDMFMSDPTNDVDHNFLKRIYKKNPNEFLKYYIKNIDHFEIMLVRKLLEVI